MSAVLTREVNTQFGILNERCLVCAWCIRLNFARANLAKRVRLNKFQFVNHL